jgi:hypothetical protein
MNSGWAWPHHGLAQADGGAGALLAPAGVDEAACGGSAYAGEDVVGQAEAGGHGHGAATPNHYS